MHCSACSRYLMPGLLECRGYSPCRTASRGKSHAKPVIRSHTRQTREITAGSVTGLFRQPLGPVGQSGPCSNSHCTHRLDAGAS